MRNGVILLVLFMSSCNSSKELKPGEWNGSLTPMNHPDMKNPVTYNVSYQADSLQIDIKGPNGNSTPARNIRLTKDTLHFVFNEPEENVRLTCALAKKSEEEFSGRCTDNAGKWALFTMKSPNAK